MAESLHHSPETITTLLIGYVCVSLLVMFDTMAMDCRYFPIQNKKLKTNQKKNPKPINAL